MALRLSVARGCGPTSQVLTDLLKKEGVKFGNDATVCWGAAAHAAHVLNGACGRYNKLQQLQRLREAGVATLEVSTQVPSGGYPWIARRLQHHGGWDMRRVKNPRVAARLLRRGWSYFTRLVPSRTEYRVWIYRRRHLGTYEKVLAHPNWNPRRRFGRNRRNGWAFQLVGEAAIPRAAVELATRAVAALGLDFGAVDVLVSTGGVSVVLEVNTAPGVEGPGRQVIQSLAHRIARWEAKGYPEANRDAE